MEIKTLLLLPTTLLGNNFQLDQGAEQDRLLEVPPTQVPIDTGVSKDVVKGWNLETRVKDFRFAPEMLTRKITQARVRLIFTYMERWLDSTVFSFILKIYRQVETNLLSV